MFRRAFCALVLLLGCSAQAQTFIVNSTADNNDPVDDLVTLREAIAQANAQEGHDTILLPAGIYIKTDSGYAISDDVTIQGVLNDEAKILSTTDSFATSLFDIERGHSVHFENLLIEGKKGTGISACGNVSTSNIAVIGIYRAFYLCSDPVDLHVFRSTVADSAYALSGRSFNEGNPAQALFESSLLADSSIFILAYDADVNVELRNSMYIGKEAYVHILGSTSMTVRDSALLISKRSTLLSARQESYWGNSSTPRKYYYPSLDIIQSTIAGNQTDHPLIRGEGADVHISHTTIVDNINNNGNLLEFVGYKQSGSNEWRGKVQIDHTIIDRFQSGKAPIGLRNVDLSARYSFLPAISRYTGSEAINLDATSSLYQGAPSYLGGLITDTSNLPYYLPQPGSPVIDAGDPESIAGEWSVPGLEQRQSDRILGGAIDIGATEYNHEPVLDEDALKAAYKEQIAALADKDEDIVLDLDNFVSDPDGHAIELIDFYSEGAVTFEPSTHIISGHRAAFKEAVMAVKMTDQTGLSAVTEMDWKPKSDGKASGGSGGGGGSLPATILGAIALLGMCRTRRRKITF